LTLKAEPVPTPPMPGTSPAQARDRHRPADPAEAFEFFTGLLPDGFHIHGVSSFPLDRQRHLMGLGAKLPVCC
jgi:hypothetical protein